MTLSTRDGQRVLTALQSFKVNGGRIFINRGMKPITAEISKGLRLSVFGGPEKSTIIELRVSSPWHVPTDYILSVSLKEWDRNLGLMPMSYPFAGRMRTCGEFFSYEELTFRHSLPKGKLYLLAFGPVVDRPPALELSSSSNGRTERTLGVWEAKIS